MEVKNKNEIPYTRFKNDTLILRDELAIDRTLLANERTLLAYLRSGISLLIAGVSIMHFSQQIWFWAVGVACLPTGLVTVLIGLIRFRRMNKAIAQVRKNQNNNGANPPECEQDNPGHD